MLRFSGRCALLACAIAGFESPLGAQDCPSKTVTIVVPLAAGTGMDTITRLRAHLLPTVAPRTGTHVETPR